MKKTILHIIESLSIGGAEVLITKYLNSFTDYYSHVVVYMLGPDTLLSNLNNFKVYCLGCGGKVSFVSAAYRLSKIIQQEKPNLIHSHLYWPTLLARLAKPKRVPLLFSVHNPLSHDAFNHNAYTLYLERLTYCKSHYPLFVSDCVKNDYADYVGLKSQHFVLENFADDLFFENSIKPEQTQNSYLKFISVGNLKEQKNYSYLVEAFAYLPDSIKSKLHLDIYGEGPCRSMLERLLHDKQIKNISLKGQDVNFHKRLNDYDVFIMSSKFEGFSLAVVEAMASGLPCLLSDVAAFRSQAKSSALYFDLTSPKDCACKIEELFRNPEKRNALAKAGLERAILFTKQIYIDQLHQIYQTLISE
ncbi:glycosyltransferase [Pontibacter silvestris]|uniref:Glycosyltransferase n=1 Tax=Pontibacter silvestris TaxID=2305183 RepID=A0ABW4WV72_9BACT|nr:glycosyltransferase [Pontibacter silvestris]MCC9138100.1 glycosyltransferase [Pontibacter silvestris]